jgi:uncharacterized protein
MEIMLDTITAVTKDLDLVCTPAELELKLDLASVQSDVNYKVAARRVADEVFLDGFISYTMKFSCARCLEEFTTSFRSPLNLVIQLVADDSLAEKDEGNDQFVVFAESKKAYNLNQHLRDLITLEVPMKPLCKADCQGLCPRCGTNFNEKRCNCTVKETDPRWEALRKLNLN